MALELSQDSSNLNPRSEYPEVKKRQISNDKVEISQIFADMQTTGPEGFDLRLDANMRLNGMITEGRAGEGLLNIYNQAMTSGNPMQAFSALPEGMMTQRAISSAKRTIRNEDEARKFDRLKKLKEQLTQRQGFLQQQPI